MRKHFRFVSSKSQRKYCLFQTPGKVAKSPKKLPKRSSRSPAKAAQPVKTSPLKEANQNAVIDSPRTPRPKRESLRQSIGKLRRSSVPFEEVDENALQPSPKSYETKENHDVYVVQTVFSPKKATVDTPKSTRKSLKRVSFGPVLSPEQFDKTLPVATPVRKGATPRRLSAPLAKPCISPARRRYSVATPSFVSKIEEEIEEHSQSER